LIGRAGVALVVGVVGWSIIGCGARTDLSLEGPMLGADAEAGVDVDASVVDVNAITDGASVAVSCRNIWDAPPAFCSVDACRPEQGREEAEAVARCVVARCLEASQFCGQIALDIGDADRKCAFGFSVDSPSVQRCLIDMFTKTRWPCLERRAGRVFFAETC